MCKEEKLKVTIGAPLSIIALYDTVAKELGYRNVDNLKYDCRKICVSNNIADFVEAYYMCMGCSRVDFGMAWVMSGPKAVETLADFEVIVEEGFIEEVA